MAKRASNTERAFDDLVDEFRTLVDSMEDVFSAAVGDSVPFGNDDSRHRRMGHMRLGQSARR